ncbi:MAG: putative RNA-binding protein (virulence factor B family) [Limisphaerales bacterium]|jgi:predicted RNA-binding protein (virulence factor B family)
MANIGKWNTLRAVEETSFGMMLDGGEHGPILTPNRYVPSDARVEDEFEVFVYLDSEDRLIATTENPLVEVGEFACLEVVSLNPNIGAFLNWGLIKDLLLPFAEQVGRVQVGQKVVVAVLLDERTGRIVASMRTLRHIDRSPPPYDTGEAVKLLITARTPLGFNAIVNQCHIGLLYKSDLTTPVAIGQSLDGYIRKVRPEGKIDLTLDQTGYGRVASLSEDIIEALRNGGGFLDVGDKSPPEQIRHLFGTSKKAFKQALGALYREKRIGFEEPGIRLIEKNPESS